MTRASGGSTRPAAGLAVAAAALELRDVTVFLAGDDVPAEACR